MRRLAFGPFVFDPSRGVLRDGQPVPINQKGLRLLSALLDKPGEVVDKAALMDAAWPGMAVEESNLSVQIAALRKLLGGAGGGGDWITTISRIGYRFTGTVTSADGKAWLAFKSRSICRGLVIGSVVVATIATVATWWWILATFVQWLVLAAIGVFV